MRRLLLISLLLLPVMALATACPTGYTNIQIITIPANTVGATLTNFPVPLLFNGAIPANSLTLTDLKSTGNGGKVQSSGNDIVFCDALSSGNLLNFERVYWLATSGKAEFHVSQTVPQTTSTVIWMFFGKASDSDHQNAAAVWTAANYVYVAHHPDGTTLSVADSSGTSTPVNHSATATTGQMDGAAAFTGGQYVDTGATQSFGTGAFSVEAWVFKTACSGNFQSVISNYNTGTSTGWWLYVCDGSGFRSTFLNPGHQKTASSSMTFSQWNYIAGTYDGAGTDTLYQNAVNVGANNGAGVSSTTSSLNARIGDWPTSVGGNSLAGSVDELRVSSVVRSASWISATYLAQTNPVAFMTLIDTSPSTVSGVTPGSGNYCLPVTIDHTKVPNTNQTNYPLYIHGFYTFMKSQANGGNVANVNGYDIGIFSDATCLTRKAHTLGFWDGNLGEVELWGLVATNSHTVDTTVYLNFGNSSITTDQSDKTTLWGNQGWVGSYSWGSPTSLSTADWGSGNLDLSVGQVGNPLPIHCPLGACLYVPNDGSTYVEWGPISFDSIGLHGYPVANAQRTECAWFGNWTGSLSGWGGSWDSIVGYGKQNSSPNGAWSLEYVASGGGGAPGNTLGVSDGGLYDSPSHGKVSQVGTSSPTYSANTSFGMHQVCATLGSGGLWSDSKVYLDGQIVTSPVTFGTQSNAVATVNNDGTSGAASKVTVGAGPGHAGHTFTGYIGPWGTNTAELSGDYIATRYNNESSPSTFYSFGTAVPVTSGFVRHRVTMF
jgi:hypothetical protein